jgi:hypothetical protein
MARPHLCTLKTGNKRTQPELITTVERHGTLDLQAHTVQESTIRTCEILNQIARFMSNDPGVATGNPGIEPTINSKVEVRVDITLIILPANDPLRCSLELETVTRGEHGQRRTDWSGGGRGVSHSFVCDTLLSDKAHSAIGAEDSPLGLLMMAMATPLHGTSGIDIRDGQGSDRTTMANHAVQTLSA